MSFLLKALSQRLESTLLEKAIKCFPKDTAELGRPETTITSDTNCKFVPKTTLRFNNLLEVLTELTESCYAHSCSSLQ